MTSETTDNPILQNFVESASKALGDKLLSVVLYGSAARGDYQEATSDLNLIVVLKNLEPATLAALEPTFKKWLRRQPFPRIFSPQLIADSDDVFPIEFLDLQSRRKVLFGEDPLAEVEIHTDHLRLQCERELREKMMRLREGFIETHGKSKDLARLLTESYTTFVALFRGCLHLLAGEVPVHNQEVVQAFCDKAELDPVPFQQVERLKRGEKSDTEPPALFSRYYAELTKAVHRINRF